GGGAARDHGLELLAAADPLRVVLAVEEFVEVEAHGRLVHAGAVHVARDAVELGAGVLLVAPDLEEPVGAAVDDVLDAAERLDVVDDRRRAERARDGGEGRLDARLAALAFDRLDQARLLAADVGAGAAVDGEVEREGGAEDLLAEEPLRVRLRDRLVEDPGAV